MSSPHDVMVGSVMFFIAFPSHIHIPFIIISNNYLMKLYVTTVYFENIISFGKEGCYMLSITVVDGKYVTSCPHCNST